MLEYTPEEKLARTAWGEKEHPPLLPFHSMGREKDEKPGLPTSLITNAKSAKALGAHA
jgi:hypothetical protein